MRKTIPDGASRKNEWRRFGLDFSIGSSHPAGCRSGVYKIRKTIQLS
jgi:hypothetical protein